MVCCHRAGPVFHKLAKHKESTIEHGVLCSDHVHMLIWITPKFAVSSVVGYVKGKSAIHVARHFMGKQRNYTGQHLWERGFFVSTVGIDEEAIRDYIQKQEDKRLDQLDFFRSEDSHRKDREKETTK